MDIVPSSTKSNPIPARQIGDELMVVYTCNHGAWCAYAWTAAGGCHDSVAAWSDDEAEANPYSCRCRGKWIATSVGATDAQCLARVVSQDLG